MPNNVLGLIEFLYKNPLSVFIVLSMAFGYAYYEQNNELRSISTEVGALRAELVKTNEIIKLKSTIAGLECRL